MREKLLQELSHYFKQHGFVISTFTEFKSCFDIAAKNSHHFFVIKVLENADSLREEQASELKKVASIFHANPVLISEKTKAFSLKKGIAYERYGIPLISVQTFEGILQKNPIYSKFFKGREIVELDSELLKKQRAKKDWSLEELGHKIGASAETIYRYEKGEKAEKQKAEKLEQKIGERLIKQINIFNVTGHQPIIFETRFSESALGKIHDLGLDLALFGHAPFKAMGQPTEPLFINLGKEKKEIQRKALVLEKTKTIFKGHSLVISKEYKLKTIQHTPIFQEEELDSYTKIHQLLEEVKKREKNKK
ncbi:helix-turn-helix domain-containing protein [Candidatus Micrarchaeota archaeon]|nr:helix-turn-helix domain-containing protein [Candidatus Micrarchaeota archaeon]MBU1930842.1 helix-turn-helix domain-containing protein [Candidatus Micrarchaeota archaeon]